ncbi:MAG: SPOR domain-containing protein [Terracidiphilus sp.]
MRGLFEEEEQAPRDKELTLGSGSLLAMLFGLGLICAIFFGLGYAMGHRGSSGGADQALVSATTAAQADGSRAKPSASASGAVQPASSSVADLSASAETAAVPPPGPQGPVAAVESAPSGQSLVRPALPGTTIQPLQASSTGVVAPAMGQPAPGSLMVQIAAVTNPEDAAVLVNALHRRGYEVAARRDAADGMIHVRIGPFNNRDEAEKWRQKLLSDGYNAIVQP